MGSYQSKMTPHVTMFTPRFCHPDDSDPAHPPQRLFVRVPLERLPKDDAELAHAYARRHLSRDLRPNEDFVHPRLKHAKDAQHRWIVVDYNVVHEERGAQFKSMVVKAVDAVFEEAGVDEKTEGGRPRFERIDKAAFAAVAKGEIGSPLELQWGGEGRMPTAWEINGMLGRIAYC